MTSSASPHVDAARERVGTLVDGRWRIDGLLAVGGTSAVYEASHRNGHRVALKVLDAELADEPTAVTHFLREGTVANRVGHPGVVAVTDEGTTSDGAPFLVMPLLSGETALDRVNRTASGLPTREALAVVDAVLDVLVAAHARGIVHRDLKPENVYLETSGSVRVLDFGIARVAEAYDRTMPGTVMGTPGYLSPEQARGQTDVVGPRSDLWSAGALLYTLLTRRTLHEAPHALQSIARAQTQPVGPARELVPGASDALASLLDGALAFDPAMRWADASAMRLALRVAMDHELTAGAFGSCAGVSVDTLGSPSQAPVALPAEPPASARAARRRVGLVALAATLAAAVTLLVAAHGSRTSRPAVAAYVPQSVATAGAGPGASAVLSPLPPAEETLPPALVVPELASAPAPSASVPRPAPARPRGAPRETIIREPGF